MSDGKKFAEGFSADKDWRKAAAEAAREARRRLGPVPCDLALVFAAETWEGFDPSELSRILAKELSPLRLLGCNASGVISGSKEVEMEPGISILAMRLPGTEEAGLDTRRAGDGHFAEVAADFLCKGAPLFAVQIENADFDTACRQGSRSRFTKTARASGDHGGRTVQFHACSSFREFGNQRMG